MDKELVDTINSSVLSVRSKVVPNAAVSAQPMQHEGAIKLYALYDYFGLDFSTRTGRDTLGDQKKVKTILDYLNENFDDINEGLRTLEQQFGSRPSNVSPLEHIYHGIKFKVQALEAQPKESQSASYKEKIADANKQIAQMKADIQAAMNQQKAAKEYAKVAERLQRVEERRAIMEAKAALIMESLKPKDVTTPSPTA